MNFEMNIVDNITQDASSIKLVSMVVSVKLLR